MKFLFLWLIGAHVLFAAPQYTNCRFAFKPYEAVCRQAVQKGVSMQYVNEFLLSAKTRQLDEKSFNLFAPQKIPQHHANEKRANNALLPLVPKIVKHLETYRKVYDLAEKKYGVSREIIAAILAKETRLGTVRPTHDAFEVFNTLLVKQKSDSPRDRRLIHMARTNMIAIIRYCYKQNIRPEACNFPSSYAGAVGIPQFMPQNFHHIEGYENVRGDLTKMEDAILSTARFLNRRAGFTTPIQWRKMPDIAKIETRWYAFDAAHTNASFAYSRSTKTGKTYRCFACGKPNLQDLARYVKRLMRYNNSSNYAIGVMRLAYEAGKGSRQ